MTETDKRQQKLLFVSGPEEGLLYLHSPADGGVVLQLPVTMSPKLEELPPVFLQKQQQRHIELPKLFCGNRSPEMK